MFFEHPLFRTTIFFTEIIFFSVRKHRIITVHVLFAIVSTQPFLSLSENDKKITNQKINIKNVSFSENGRGVPIGYLG